MERTDTWTSRLTDHSVTQLRLTNANTVANDIQKMCGLALSFEKGAFENAADRVSYNSTGFCAEELAD